jgi:hypothetical protein
VNVSAKDRRSNDSGDKEKQRINECEGVKDEVGERSTKTIAREVARKKRRFGGKQY